VFDVGDLIEFKRWLHDHWVTGMIVQLNPGLPQQYLIRPMSDRIDDQLSPGKYWVADETLGMRLLVKSYGLHEDEQT
jgi:hypothetical protein